MPELLLDLAPSGGPICGLTRPLPLSLSWSAFRRLRPATNTTRPSISSTGDSKAMLTVMPSERMNIFGLSVNQHMAMAEQQIANGKAEMKHTSIKALSLVLACISFATLNGCKEKVAD